MPNTPNSDSYDLVILGAGSAGLSVAAVAGSLGFKVALCEGGKMGGDCLNTGCVPSKALLAAAKAAHTARHSRKMGVDGTHTKVNFAKVMRHVHGVISAIAPHDSQERFESLGVRVIRHHGVFTDPYTVRAGEHFLKAKRFVIATGSRASVPPIEGIQNVPHLTNETIFGLHEKPEHLIVIGGGPIGCEMAQAFRRLGSRVTLLESASRIMLKDDVDLSDMVFWQFRKEGVPVWTDVEIHNVWPESGGIHLKITSRKEGMTRTLSGSHLLVAAGRQPNTKDLGLEAAEIRFNKRGIPVDAQMRTNQPHIYAIGDVTGPYQFTHMAGYQAGLVIQRSLFGNIFAKASYNAVPWITYTTPEAAQVGLSPQQAVEKYGEENIRVTTLPYHALDRAQAEGKTEGIAKVVTLEKGFFKKGRVIGACIGGAHAGELIHTWAYMVQHKQKIGKLLSVIHAYPGWSELNKKLASEYYRETFYSEKTQKISQFLFRWLG